MGTIHLTTKEKRKRNGRNQDPARETRSHESCRCCQHLDENSHKLMGLKKKTTRMAYDIGVASEDLFRVLCMCDDVVGDDDVRKLRKALVLQIKQSIAHADNARSAALRLAKFVKQHSLSMECPSSSDSEASEQATTPNTPQDAANSADTEENTNMEC